jgi:hypothetical protein
MASSSTLSDRPQIDYAALAKAAWDKTVKPAYGHGWELLTPRLQEMYVGLVEGAFEEFFERADWQRSVGAQP